MVKFIILVFAVAVLAIIATSIISYGGAENFMNAVGLAFTKAGRLTIGAEPPTIEYVHIDSPGSDTDCTATPGDCATDPEEDNYHDPEFRVRVRDGNGDCDAPYFKVYITLCNPGGGLDCAPAGSRWGAGIELELNYVAGSKSGSYCDYEWPTGAANSYKMDYWEVAGNSYEWYVHATDDNGITWNSDDPVRGYWEYTSLPSFMYPVGDTDGYIDYSNPSTPLSLDVFNEGRGGESTVDSTGDVETKNGGNTVTQVEWQCTDFNDGGTNYIEINGVPSPNYPNYYLDDDQDNDDFDTTDLDKVAFADTPDNTNYGTYVTWPSASEGYLDVCTSHVCDSDPTAHFNTYYHLYLPAGQATGTYTNSIQINFGAAP